MIGSERPDQRGSGKSGEMFGAVQVGQKGNTNPRSRFFFQIYFSYKSILVLDFACYRSQDKLLRVPQCKTNFKKKIVITSLFFFFIKGLTHKYFIVYLQNIHARKLKKKRKRDIQY